VRLADRGVIGQRAAVGSVRFYGESMRSVILLASCLALAGCADITARQQILSERGPQYLTRFHDLTLQPYREWLQTEPVDCKSPKLLEARASVLDTALLIKPKGAGLRGNLRLGCAGTPSTGLRRPSRRASTIVEESA
jgi:hypothetical protein